MITTEALPVHLPGGRVATGLHQLRITLRNEAELNSFTTEMLADLADAFRRAGSDPAAVAVVLTGAGARAFSTGGNAREYAERYVGRPEAYRRYLRLFVDAIDAILACEKPVICRVNGMRIGGGQELGMACDYSVAQDLAVFGQAGPRHGSAPDGGSTDFLSLFVGIERAFESCTLCETWSAHEAHRYGLLTEVVPALRVQGALLPNPLVITDRYVDPATGRIVHGTRKTGKALERGRALLASGTVDLGPLDAAVERLVGRLLLTFPGCLGKTIESLRKKKREAWDRNKESNRSWLALNMLTEARAGFRAFAEGAKGSREVDFVELRRRLASGENWSDELIEAIQPRRA